MACCYIAASMIAFIIRSCEALDINLNLQYNESVKPEAYDEEELGYTSPDKTETHDGAGITVVSIYGMTCAACVTNVESALLQVEGVDQALVNLALQEARLFHGSAVDYDQVIQSIEHAGYDAKIGERSKSQKIETLQHSEELTLLRGSLRGLAIYSTAIFSLGKGIDYTIPVSFSGAREFALLRSLALLGLTGAAAMKHGGWIIERAAISARQGRTNMHSLIAASTAVGILLSMFDLYCGQYSSQYYDTIVGTLLIITVGRYVDLLSRRQAANTFVGLYSLMDETAYVKLANIEVRDSSMQVDTSITMGLTASLETSTQSRCSVRR